MPSARQVLFGVVSSALAIAGLSVALPMPAADASVSTKISSFPYTQDWSGLSSTSVWGDFQGVEGFNTGTSIVAANQPNTLDAGTLTTEGTLTSTLGLSSVAVPNADTTGGIRGFYTGNKVIGLNTSASQTAPVLVFHLDTTGKSSVNVAYDVIDIDNSADDQPQRVALQYRVGTSGAYTNVPAGYVADATSAGATAKTTAVSAALPAAANNQGDVYVRVFTIDNATLSNEHVGIDNINITAVDGTGTTPLDVTAPGNKTGEQDLAITPFTMAATGGTAPYTWSATGLPAGVSINPTTGEVSGTPSATCTCSVTVTATDSASPTHATADETFTFTVNPAPTLTPIDEVQGTTGTSPKAGQNVTVQGVVTALYRTGGFNGMYVQTAGTGGATDATPDASDAIFVFGASNIPAGVVIGDSVRVTGAVSEFFGTTEITSSAGSVVELGTPLAPVTGLQIAYPATDAGREAQEGMLLAPTDTWTIADVYSINVYGEITLATGDHPLKQPTEYVDRSDAAGIQAIVDDNKARAVVLNDGATTNFQQNQTNKAIPLPYLTAANGSPVANAPRVGAHAVLQAPVILEYRNGLWNFEPRQQVTGDSTYPGSNVISFADDRTGNLAPRNVGGDITLATFNVQNYFLMTGEEYADADNLLDPPQDLRCTYYTDRESNRISDNSCGVQLLDDPDTATNEANQNSGSGPRGAATTISRQRQEAKIVTAINSLDASIIALEEVENSIKLPGQTNRDAALAHIVDLLNTAAGSTKWKYVKSPGEATTASAIAEQDVIRPAFIYQPAEVQPVGQSDILFGTNEFANAREPLAQAFKATGAPNSDAFAVVGNHFKSKGDSGAQPADGDNTNDAYVGAFNGDRTRQATRLVQFANDFAAAHDTDKIFMLGDFNAYSHEDPVNVIKNAGFDLLESDEADDNSYAFSTLMGSLDHVFANGAAEAMVTGTDVWEINANESIAYNFSRHNYNLTNFWQPNLPFATSDHNPEVIGINLPDFTPTTTKQVQIVSTNDFHGRILPDGGNAAGAAPFSSAVNDLRSEVPAGNTIFAAAGDLIGASTFESFVQHDEPTIDAFNAMGLEVSSAGNHEFDQGYEDFVGRVQDRADWEYIAANVHKDGDNRLAPTWTKTVDGVKVGFVGAVTEDLPTLVNPALMTGVTVSDIVDATNAAAADLKADGADVVVLLVHEGSPSTDCSSTAFTDPATVWGNIVQNTSADVDAIVSGHTHLAYNCRFPVADWAGHAVTKRPVVSAGQYGTNLNQLVFNFDTANNDLLSIEQDLRATAGVGYAADPAVQPIVDAAVTYANNVGSNVLGQTDGPINRAIYNPPGAPGTENRGGESTLGNEVAEIQRWATQLPDQGVEADIAFMNPGGLRKNLVVTANGNGAYDVKYRDAANVQPFANTLVNMDLTGAQIKTVLEQQWQRTPTGNVPSRPFLRLGVSKGFTYTYKTSPETVSIPPAAPVTTTKGTVTGMWLNGVAIDPAATYSVTVNSFLSTGGDNFHELAHGSNVVDTGKVDLQAMVDYLKQYDTSQPGNNPLAVDYSQRAVEVELPVGAPASYAPGDTVAFDISSWSMSNAGDTKDTEVQVKLEGAVVTTATLDNTLGNKPYDNTGTAHVSFTLPAGTHKGKQQITLVGAQTGTSIPVDITVTRPTTDIQIIGTNDFHGRLIKDETPAGQHCADTICPAAVLSGAVKSLRASNPNTVFAAAGDLIGASTFESFVQNDNPTIDALNEAGLEVSSVGNHEFDQGYEDLVGRVQDRANWEYIGANVEEPAGRDDLAETWTKTMNGIEIGFVGAVTEDLPALVSPGGMTGVTITDVVDATNAAAADLKAGGADIVVLLVHEGAPVTDCASSAFTDPSTVFGNIAQNTSPDVDAIISGHTHLLYDCSFTVQDWVTEGRDVTKRPVVSSGQYGTNLNKLVFTVDNGSGDIVAKSQSVLALTEANYTEDPAVVTIVNNAIDYAAPIGAQVLGPIAGPFNRAKLANGTTENRGGESTLGNLVAEVQRAETPADQGGAEIAFMNPGGLRADMIGTLDGSNVRQLTYRQAANVQPFANGLTNMDMTGAQIKTVLEQQWQRDSAGKVPTRPFLRLGVSKGFTYTYVETPITLPGSTAGSTVDTFQGTVTGMWLNGEPIDPAQTYSVTVNSFLATGGDNFREFSNGTGKAQWGVTDLQAMVHYMSTHTGVDPLPVDYSQRAVEVHNVASSYDIGSNVTFDVKSWTMSTAADVKDSEITVKLGDTVLGTATLDNTIGTAVYDAYGTAHVSVALPGGTTAGRYDLTLVGASTGTKVTVPIEVHRATTTLTVDNAQQVYGKAGTMHITASAPGVTPTGYVSLKSGGVVIGTALLTGGEANAIIPAKKLGIGDHTVTVNYAGDGSVKPAVGTGTLTVVKATPTLANSRTVIEYGNAASVPVRVLATGVVPTGTVTLSVNGNEIGTGTLTNGAVNVDVAALALPAKATAYQVDVAYSGDGFVESGNGTVVLVVSKATPTVTGSDATMKVGGIGHTDVTVTTSTGVTPTGKVVLLYNGTTIGAATLTDGAASVTILRNKLPTAGTYDVTVKYNGDGSVKQGTDAIQVTVNP